MLMESLFRLTDLEVRVSAEPQRARRPPHAARDGPEARCSASGSPSRSRCWSAAPQHRVGKIDDRLELLEGYLIAFLNLDRVIEIIRAEDEPKPVLIAEFALTDRQAEAILNMRLRSLRRLEEMQLQGARHAHRKEREELQKLIEFPVRQRTRLKKDLAALRERYGPETVLGRRRTTIEEAAPAREIPLEAMIEREPITVIMSKRGWIRAMKGHVELSNAEALKFKEGDSLRLLLLHAQTTDKLLLASTAGVSTRSPPTNCRAGAASASRSNCSSTSKARAM